LIRWSGYGVHRLHRVKAKIVFASVFFVCSMFFSFSQEPQSSEAQSKAEQSTQAQNSKAQGTETQTGESQNTEDTSDEYEEDYDLIMENEQGLTLTKTKESPNTVTQEEMERSGANDLWEAVQDVPGVIMSGGGRRGDSNFSVRGFGADEVPVFVDGILMANPYRGESDSARFLTGDLESIVIQKGFSSELLGANTLGGAVLINTAKPQKKLELTARSSLDIDNVFSYSGSNNFLSAGTRQKYFYAKAGVQYRDIDHWRLPESFEPTAGNPQGKGNRMWSASKDLKVSGLLGTTPIPGLDVWFNGSYQWADKGLSPPDIRTRDYYIWDWVIWNRYTVSLNANYELEKFSLNALGYFDKYNNRLDEYANAANFKAGYHLPHSDYDEWTAGSRLTGKWYINEKNEVSAALTYKDEYHRGLTGGKFLIDYDVLTEVIHIEESTVSFGAEWKFIPHKKVTLIAGAGFDTLIPLDYWPEYNDLFQKNVVSKRMLLYNWEGAAYYSITDEHKLHLSYARKNHFPTMSDRYSTRSGRRKPNPNLGPEIANHIELGYAGSFFSTFDINSAVYYSIMTGKIVDVQIPDDDPYGNPSVQVDYARNLDSSSFYGTEISCGFFPNKYFNAGVTFSLNEYFLNKTQDATIKHIPYYPEITANAYMIITPIPQAPQKLPVLKKLSIIPRIEYVGERYIESSNPEDGSPPPKLSGYFLAHLRLQTEITNYLTFSIYIKNIFDTFYEIRYNSPQPGRSYTFTLEAKY